ncbi:uncharacterized protein LOC127718044 isoform X2 [Mytilus californianus]|uniref:uncharacterized protein LOC127718044 isoform X2 n=1 Tax=Mytilus californianus TaxID=6549 RepID=UPI002245C201|nr:uncharacterized protein LOC127718044 isoform X2 [Mytilus californianus]
MEKIDEILLYAAKDGRLYDVILCLKYRADINCQDMNGRTPLHYAVKERHKTTISLLLERGSDQTRKDEYGRTSLHYAVKDGYLNTVSMLLKHGSDPNMKNKYGRTPLHYAVKGGHKNIVSLLIKRGLDLNLQDKFGGTSLHWAADFRHPEIFIILLKSGSDSSIKNISGKTPYDRLKEVLGGSVDTKELDLVLESVELIIQEKENEKPETARVLKELRGLGLETISDLQEVLKLGQFKCYWNRIYLVGPYNSGKSCLAKILVGEPIPKERESTDGIWIYIGRAGMDLEKTQWMCFPKGCAVQEVLRSMLMTISKSESTETPQYDINTSQYITMVPTTKVTIQPVIEDNTSSSHPELASKSIEETILKSDVRKITDSDCSMPKFQCDTSNWPDSQTPSSTAIAFSDNYRGANVSEKETTNESTIPFGLEICAAQEKNIEEVPVATKNSFTGILISKSKLSSIHAVNKETDKSRGLPEDRNVSSVSYEEQLKKKISSELSHKKIHQLVTQAITNGQYKQTVIPIDIWDFGGQKDYHMTHQLFITSRGIFVLMFNGSIDLKKARRDLAFMQGYSAKRSSVAVYLIHWVNSILTYSKRLDKGFPRIVFVATHKDKIAKKKQASHRNKLMDQIGDLFKSHAGLKHLDFRPLIFINAIDINDPEIEDLRMGLMNRAREHPRWGELMPTVWVPLELQLLMEVEKGINIMSKKQLEMLNSQNESMVLTEQQLETFLLVQHSLGKVLYFNTNTLRNFDIIKPAFLVDVLRSIVTEKQFWIKERRFVRILQSLIDTGFVEREDIYLIWNQDAFNQILPYREFMIEVLVHLDILVAPQPHDENLNYNIQDISRFLVPCMITRPNKTKYMKKFCTSKTSIVMSYTFIEEVIPPALTYRFLGSFVTMWGVKNYKGKKRMLFSDLAVVEVDKSHDVAVQVLKNRVVVFLIHSERKENIIPTLASSVQECLSVAVHRISEFYSTLSEESNTLQQNSHMVMPFEIDFGVHCKTSVCFFPLKEIPTSAQNQGWRCSCHRRNHDVSSLRLWFSETMPHDQCDESCIGLDKMKVQLCPEEKHLRRLVAGLTNDICRELFISLEMETSIWDDVRQQFNHLHPDDSKFTSLIRWKEGRRNPTFQDIVDALEKCNLDKHLLCQVFRDVVPDTSGKFVCHF